ncbi:MAG: PepSY-associated TM helix domain-containing protein [Arachidicoccus sp.]|nr:PepSY-associated TM helix domain-containing protein [Arachidicoccus sp.]
MPINKKSKVNNVITWLHLWLGLVSGIIVCLLGITGCIYAFEKELSSVFYKKIIYIDNPSGYTQTLAFSVIKNNAQQYLGKDKPVSFATTFPNDPHHAWEFMCYQQGDNKALWMSQTIKTYESVFVNPYTGKITGHLDYKHEFFALVKGLHISLLLNTKYGEIITGTATLLFVIILITGFVMWYPKKWNKKNIDNSFKINWKAKWKRINYDLHNVLGFYVCIIAFIIACTGLTMAFNWFRAIVYVAASASITAPDFKTYKSDTTKPYPTNAYDISFEEVKKIYPKAQRIGVSISSKNSDAISMTAYHLKDVYYNDDKLYFDKASGKKLGAVLYDRENNGVKFLTMNYDIHIGAIGGIIGKIIAFLISLVCASLPITGFIIWLNKKKKLKKKNTNKFYRINNSNTSSIA